jgi:hypothetical protein
MQTYLAEFLKTMQLWIKLILLYIKLAEFGQSEQKNWLWA